MSQDAAQMEALRPLCGGAVPVTDGDTEYIFLPGLKVTVGDAVREVDGLLCPTQVGGYTTRLYLSVPVTERQNNWQCNTILGRNWHTWSWNNVPANIPLVQMLLEHLRALR